MSQHTARWFCLIVILPWGSSGQTQRHLTAQEKRPLDSKPQEPTQTSAGLDFFDPTTYRLRITIHVEAPRSAIRNVIATGPVPIDWPEQKVKLLDESKPKGSRTRVRPLAGQAAMLTFLVPFIPAGGSATVQRDYEVTRFCTRLLIPPERLKTPGKTSRQFHTFLSAAPGVEVSNRKIVALAKSLRGQGGNEWITVQRFHNWVRQNIRYQTGDYAGAKHALERRTGDCEDMTALFVALCRAVKIPARSVWIEGHAYPEFYLVDNKRNGYWIPAELTGPARFGKSKEYRPILQKGDRILDPIRRRYTHYVPQSTRASGGTARLSVSRRIIQDATQKTLQNE